MKKRMLALGCAAAVLLSGCASGTASGSGGRTYRVYYSAMEDEQAGTAVDWVEVSLSEQTEPVPALMSALLATPGEDGLSSPFPAGVRLRSWEIEEGRLHLDLSEQYNGLSGVNLTLADCCMALTFEQLDGVESVYVTAEGREIPYRRVQQLAGEDVLLAGGEDIPIYVGVNLWYPRAEGDGLGVEYRSLLKTEEHTLVETVLLAWMEGPQYEWLRSCMPEKTEVRSVSVMDGVCTVDLSEQFRDNAPTGWQETRLMLYALVNTLCGLEQASQVSILVEGEPLPYLNGVRLDGPLSADLSLEVY